MSEENQRTISSRNTALAKAEGTIPRVPGATADEESFLISKASIRDADAAYLLLLCR